MQISSVHEHTAVTSILIKYYLPCYNLEEEDSKLCRLLSVCVERHGRTCGVFSLMELLCTLTCLLCRVTLYAEGLSDHFLSSLSVFVTLSTLKSQLTPLERKVIVYLHV